jgi:hypothetical protein
MPRVRFFGTRHPDTVSSIEQGSNRAQALPHRFNWTWFALSNTVARWNGFLLELIASLGRVASPTAHEFATARSRAAAPVRRRVANSNKK